MFIRSERLFLRPAWPEDWADLHALFSDEAVVRNLMRAPWPYGPEDAKAFVAREGQAKLPGLMITLPGADGARLIGGVGLNQDGDEVELGYWIGRPFWGRGYATEATHAMLSLAQAIGHKRLSASHFVDNQASGRVLRKLGFCPAGAVRNRYSMGRGEAAPAHQLSLTLGEPSNCDGDDMAAPRAA